MWHLLPVAPLSGSIGSAVFHPEEKSRQLRRPEGQIDAGDHRGNPRDQDVRVGSQFCQSHQPVALGRYSNFYFFNFNFLIKIFYYFDF